MHTRLPLPNEKPVKIYADTEKQIKKRKEIERKSKEYGGSIVAEFSFVIHSGRKGHSRASLHLSFLRLLFYTRLRHWVRAKESVK